MSFRVVWKGRHGRNQKEWKIRVICLVGESRCLWCGQEVWAAGICAYIRRDIDRILYLVYRGMTRSGPIVRMTDSDEEFVWIAWYLANAPALVTRGQFLYLYDRGRFTIKGKNFRLTIGISTATRRRKFFIQLISPGLRWVSHYQCVTPQRTPRWVWGKVGNWRSRGIPDYGDTGLRKVRNVVLFTDHEQTPIGHCRELHLVELVLRTLFEIRYFTNFNPMNSDICICDCWRISMSYIVRLSLFFRVYCRDDCVFRADQQIDW